MIKKLLKVRDMVITERKEFDGNKSLPTDTEMRLYSIQKNTEQVIEELQYGKCDKIHYFFQEEEV